MAMFLGMELDDVLDITLLQRMSAGQVDGTIQTNRESWSLWSFTITPPEDFLGMDKVAAKLMAHYLRTLDTPFMLPVPQHQGVEAPAAGVTLRLTEGGSVLSDELAVTNAGLSVGVIDEGIFFTISGDTRLYAIKELNGKTIAPAATQTVEIFPRLGRAAANNATLNLRNPQARVIYDPTDRYELLYRQNVFRKSLTLIEKPD